MTQNKFSGEKSISNLSHIIRENGTKKIFLISSSRFKTRYGGDYSIVSQLNEFAYFHFHDFSVNPKIEDLTKGIALYKEHQCDFLLAVGGGSALDLGKLIRGMNCRRVLGQCPAHTPGK